MNLTNVEIEEQKFFELVKLEAFQVGKNLAIDWSEHIVSLAQSPKIGFADFFDEDRQAQYVYEYDRSNFNFSNQLREETQDALRRGIIEGIQLCDKIITNENWADTTFPTVSGAPSKFIYKLRMLGLPMAFLGHGYWLCLSAIYDKQLALEFMQEQLQREKQKKSIQSKATVQGIMEGLNRLGVDLPNAEELN